MCRKARMFAPLKIWRKWHRKVNITQRRHAVAAALAASAVTPLVMARGHSVANVPELPLVIGGLTDSSLTTKSLLTALNNHGCGDDLLKVRKSKNTRAGVGKYRRSRYVMRKGPLLVFGDDSEGVRNAARNLPGVDTCHVNRLNVLQLAPGGHLGRFVVFTQDAFKGLNHVFGSHTRNSQQKSHYTLNRNLMNCADLARIINSDQVQSKLRETRTSVRAHDKTKKNPLRNQALRNRLDPFNKDRIAADKAVAAANTKGLAAKLKAKRSKAGRAAKHTRNVRDQGLQSGLEQSYRDAQAILDEEERLGNYQPGDTSEEED
jgi:large subunit ribosomal protein L4e